MRETSVDVEANYGDLEEEETTDTLRYFGIVTAVGSDVIHIMMEMMESPLLFFSGVTEYPSGPITALACACVTRRCDMCTF